MIVRQVSPWGAGWNTPTGAVAQMRRVDGHFRLTEVYFDPLRKRALAA